MGGLRAIDSLKGTISTHASLQGKLSEHGNLKGAICVTREYEAYVGEYRVTPKAFEAQILRTENRVLKEDISIAEVPYWETSNESDGTTAYIAREVDTNGDQ